MQRSNIIADFTEMTERFARDIINLPIPVEPTRLDPARKDWAKTAMAEELTEFSDATTLADEADALIDLTYFALGRLVEMGLAPRPLFEEVHAANMRKEQGELSKRPNSKGHDAIKPDGWTGPNLEPYLRVTQEDMRFLGRLSGPEDVLPVSANELQRELPKVLVLGYGRHGKDTVCERLRDVYGFDFTSSSEFCAEHIVLPKVYELHDKGEAPAGLPWYADAEACFADRANHRAFWFDTIAAYCEKDPSRLGTEIFAQHDVYAGLRSKREFNGLKNVGGFDVCIWVDASDRLPPEDKSSCTVEPWMADFTIDNNGTEAQLRNNVDAFVKTMLGD